MNIRFFKNLVFCICASNSGFVFADNQQQLKCVIYYEALSDHRFIDQSCAKSKCINVLLEKTINQYCHPYLPIKAKLQIQSASTQKMLSRIEDQGKTSFCDAEIYKRDRLHKRFGFCISPITQELLDSANDNLLNDLFFR